jgi:anti-sigma-K factor RskA
VLSQAAGLEQRLADLEAQIERLNDTLLRWRETENPREPVERQLAQLSDQFTGVLKQWTATSERHAEAVGELESRLAGWSEIETRLQRDATWRFQGLERTIEREWAAIRLLHEEPVRQLREHAESLTEICVNTAGSAQTGIERAEARLAALESDLHRRIDSLSSDLHAVLAELRRHGGPALRGPASAWPLDEVIRLHEELRDGATADGNGTNVIEGRVLEGSTMSSAPASASPVQEPAGPTPVATPHQPLSILGHDEAGERAQGDRFGWKWFAAVATLAVAVAVVAGLAWSFYRQATVAAEHASEAQQRAQQIASAADERIEAARQAAAAQMTLAHDAASKAQVTGDVLAASDLVRYNLVGGDPAARTLAQLLWSRSRGLVFSASRMPPPPQGFVYQLWLLTAGAPIGVGTVAPDASGRVTLATDSPPDAPRPIVGVRVTIEPAPGRPAPSGPVALAPVVLAPPQ